MFTNSTRILSYAMLAASLCFVSCDDAYDLSKDINSDIQIGQQFRVPVGHTDTIYVNRIIEESETLTQNNGIYEVTSNGSTDTKISPLDDVTVHNFTPALSNIDIQLPQIGAVASGSTIEIGAISTSGFYNIDEILPREVEALYSADFKGGNVITTLSMAVNPIPAGIDAITFRNLTMTFPDFVTLDNGSNSFSINEVTLNATSNTFTCDIPVASFSITPEQQDQYIFTRTDGRKYLVFTEAVTITADAAINISGNISQQEMEVEFEYYMTEETVELNGVAGIFNTDANVSSEIAINNIPDFLSTGNTSFTPEEVYLYLDLLNPANIPGSFDINLASIKGNKNSGCSVNINVQADAMNNILLSNFDAHVDGYTTTVEPSLVNLFQFVPERIEITSDDLTLASTNSSQKIELGVEYPVSAKYKAVVPFKFSNLNIEYRDSIDNLLEDLEDVADKTNRIIVRATGITDIPANLEASVALYDIAGNELTGIDTDVSKFKFTAAPDGQESTNELEITLTEHEGSNDLERLEKIVYTVFASSTDGITLRPHQFLYIKDIFVELPDGITLTL